MNEINELHKLSKSNGAHQAPAPQTPTLPPERAAAVEAGLAQYQAVLAERDELRKSNTEMHDRIAALQIEAEGLRRQLDELMDQASNMMGVRDQAVADRVKYEALFVGIQAQMRAFAVPSEPLITDADGERD